ncbi:cation/cationic drug transporter [Paenibacillus chartarius]|uniref:Cation/cationic drug transporter n=1 Tax=Paenibacillus chartarius TaxID=747481 RepID=A0ABV6DMT6_9BACL
MQAYAFAFSSILLGAAGQVLMKLGTNKLGGEMMPSLVPMLRAMLTSPFIMAGLMCYGISAVLWIFTLSRLPLSQAYPLVAAGYVIVFVFSVFVLKETVTAAKLGAMLLIVAGVVVLAKS